MVGEDYAVAGNMLVGSKVIEAMAQKFRNSEGELAERLLKTLEAGQEAGGDKRGRMSATLLVAGKEQRGKRSILDLRVDEHSNPVGKLRGIFETAVTKRKL